jgi:hypothetical protein
MSMGPWWNAIDRGKPKYSEKNPSQCHFKTKKYLKNVKILFCPMLPAIRNSMCMSSNLGLQDEKPAT